MRNRIVRSTLLACIVAALCAAPASAGTSAAVAAGLGGKTTHCTLSVVKKDWSFSSFYNFSGSTTCSAAVQQSCHVALGDLDGGTQSLFGTTCSVAGEGDGDYPGNVVYNATVAAPAGQTWLVVPNGCSGLDSATLSCTLTANSIAGEST